MRRATPSTVVRNRIEDESKSNGVPLSLSFKKPSWVVRTEASCALFYFVFLKKKRKIILFIHRGYSYEEKKELSVCSFDWFWFWVAVKCSETSKEEAGATVYGVSWYRKS